MTSRPLLLVSCVLLASLTLLVWTGQRVLERDRDALFERYGHERGQGIEEAARAIEGEVGEIGEDLELAATLLRGANTIQIAERELHAIATIKREYLMMHAITGTGETTKVTAYDAPAGVGAQADPALDQLLQRAAAEPGMLHASTRFVEAADRAWYRVYARRPERDGPAVAVLVDMSLVVSRLKVSRGPMTRLAVLDPSGTPTPSSDRGLATALHVPAGELGAIVARIDAGEHTTTIVDGDVARSIGLPDAAAAVIAVPLKVDGGSPWRLVVVASTDALEDQERTIVRRVLAGGVLVLVLLVSAAAYVVRNTLRARTMRERLKHADRLAHLTEKAEKILDHIPNGVLALSEDRRVTGVNRWLAERLGRDVIGCSLENTFEGATTDDVALVVGLIEKCQRTREAQLLHRERITLLGREASLNLHAVPLAHRVGDVAVLLVIDDLTELRRIEHRLLHSEKLVTAGQLAAGIAHEVGTPLNVARGRVELSLSHLGPEHAESANQRVVIDQIDRVTRLLQQLLDYVRSAPVAIRDLDLAEPLRVVHDLLAAQASKRKVVLELDAVQGAPLRADPDQVQQIVLNLVLNAIDACDSGGTVTLRAKSTGNATVLEIVDDGHGIPPDIQKQVFDPFFTTKKRGQGTGLGLWVVAQLVRAQAAEIELDSSPGRGTTVRVAWPVTS